MKDLIEEIPKTMEKFMGCAGKMVKPSPNTVADLIANIHSGELATITQLRAQLANDFEVQTACPAAIMKSLVILSKSNPDAPYWRVIKNKGELIAKFPGGLLQHAQLLENEGLKIDPNKKTPVVIDFKSKLSTAFS
ncbi:MGMT family protein [Agaribacter marinus]|uniref:Methylated-DNA-[protein]-cysteine S-methyltransferase DNA binding domain-containing protein n=1 Tax=Agaribacter marinus TaxID=1431249 RepID=A0AA37SUD6_9ALTE|nr:MGMT family protein [Agaribacter marinus]GLR69337.1 hypothetical protein GCM10007852_02450 [Agaribacter marinus]